MSIAENRDLQAAVYHLRDALFQIISTGDVILDELDRRQKDVES